MLIAPGRCPAANSVAERTSIHWERSPCSRNSFTLTVLNKTVSPLPRQSGSCRKRIQLRSHNLQCRRNVPAFSLSPTYTPRPAIHHFFRSRLGSRVSPWHYPTAIHKSASSHISSWRKPCSNNSVASFVASPSPRSLLAHKTKPADPVLPLTPNASSPAESPSRSLTRVHA